MRSLSLTSPCSRQMAVIFVATSTFESTVSCFGSKRAFSDLTRLRCSHVELQIDDGEESKKKTRQSSRSTANAHLALTHQAISSATVPVVSLHFIFGCPSLAFVSRDMVLECVQSIYSTTPSSSVVTQLVTSKEWWLKLCSSHDDTQIFAGNFIKKITIIMNKKPKHVCSKLNKD